VSGLPEEPLAATVYRFRHGQAAAPGCLAGFCVIIGRCRAVSGPIRVGSVPREGLGFQLCVRAARDPGGITRHRRPMFATP